MASFDPARANGCVSVFAALSSCSPIHLRYLLVGQSSYEDLVRLVDEAHPNVKGMLAVCAPPQQKLL